MLLRGSSFGGLASSRKSPRSIIYKARRSEGDAEALASKLEPELAKAILDAFVKQQGKADVDAIITALEAGDVGKVLELLDLPASIAAFEGVTSSLHTGANAAGAMAAAQVALQVKGVSFAFNSLNPRLITWLQTYSLRLIRQISDGTREGIRQYLTQGMKDGKNPKAVARQIKGIIGLTDKQAQAVYNYRKELETFHLKRSAGSWGLGNKIDQVNGTQVLRPGEDGSPLDGIGQRSTRWWPRTNANIWPTALGPSPALRRSAPQTWAFRTLGSKRSIRVLSKRI